GPAPTMTTSVFMLSFIPCSGSFLAQQKRSLVAASRAPPAVLGNRSQMPLHQGSLALPLRRGDDEPVKFLRDLDLTRKPRIGLNLISKVEHIFFLVRCLAS